MSPGVMEQKDQQHRRKEIREPSSKAKSARVAGCSWAGGDCFSLLVAGGFTLLHRRSQYQALAKETETLAMPTVSVVHPIAAADAEDLVLPSTMQAYVESPIYARTSGYLKKWYHDIGSRVRQGELLADIDAPKSISNCAISRRTGNCASESESFADHRFALRRAAQSDSVSKQEADNAPAILPRRAPTPNRRKPMCGDCRRRVDSSTFTRLSAE